MFKPKDGRANRRSYCYDNPECEKKHKQKYYTKKLEITRRWKNKQGKIVYPDDILLCTICRKPLPDGFRYRHDQCAARVAKYSRIDDDWIFMDERNIDESADTIDFLLDI